MQIDTQSYTGMHVQIYALTHTYIHLGIHTKHTHTHTQRHAQTYMQTFPDIDIHTRIDADIHMYTHTHLCVDKDICLYGYKHTNTVHTHIYPHKCSFQMIQ